MNKKAFTLVELLLVITLLGLLSLLIVPNVDRLVNNSKERLYNAQLKSIEDAAENFITDYFDEVNDLSKFTIDLKLLKDLAYVEYGIKNPKTEEYFSDDSLITFNKINNIHQATFFPIDADSIGDVTKYAKHIVLLRNGSTYTGSSYKATSNVILFDLEGRLYNSSQYAVVVTNEDSIINAGFQTVTYTITLTEDGVNYTYVVKRDEKSA